MRAIPLVLVAGFLGAGKTTFLRALMTSLRKQGLGYSVIVNDFENADVDAERLRSLQDQVQAINGSCVCCSSFNDLMTALAQAEVPEGGVLLLEVNGASDLINLIAGMTLRHECRRYTSPLQVTMIDAKRWRQRGEQNSLEREQVQTSTHWQITHLEGVDRERIEAIEQEVSLLSPRAIPTEAEAFAKYLRLLVGSLKFPKRDKQPEANKLFDSLNSPKTEHHHEAERAFTSLKAELPFVVQRRDLESTLSDLPDTVLRVKGVCRLAELPQIPMSFQHVRPTAETWFLPMLHVTDIVPTTVVIGVGLEAEVIKEAFQAMPSAELEPGFDPNDL